MRTKQLSLRLALLGGVSILPMAIVFAAPAVAACPAALTGNETGPVETTSGCDFAIAGGGVISGGSTGVINQVGIGALANNGAVTGGLYGINNRLTPISQPHVIVWGAVSSAIPGTIGTLTNTSLITGGSAGIHNDGAIGTLVNSGDIIGETTLDFGHGDGIANAGTIAAAANSGVITGGGAGVSNTGSIGALNNEAGGDVFGYLIGLVNQGAMASLTNGGVIAGDRFGISNTSQGGTLASLTNNGFISGGTPGADSATYVRSTTEATAGILNRGDIGQLTNTGVISGGNYGILSLGTIGDLLNSGSIAGGDAGLVMAAGEAINLPGGIIKGGAGLVIGTATSHETTSFNTSVGGASLVNGGVGIGGLSNSGTIGGTIGIGTVTVSGGHAILNVFSNTATITNPIAMPGAIVINDGIIEGAEGAVFTGAGNTLINAGTIVSSTGGNAIDFGAAENFLTLATGSVIEGTIFGGGTDGQITLDGTGAMANPLTDFGAGSALEIAQGADWTASGNWQIAQVTNDGVFQPGVAGAALNLAGNFVQNSDGTLRVLVSPAASPFATTHFVITGTASLAGAVKYYFAPGTYKPGTVAFLSATGGITGGFSAASYILPPAGLAGQTLIFSSDGDLRFAALAAVAPLDDSLFSDEIQAGAAQAQQANTALLGKAVAGDAAAGSCAAPAGMPQGQTSVQKLTSAVAGAICGAGGWIQAEGTAMRADGDTDEAGYGANTAGFLAGIGKAVNNAGLRLGIALGYDETALQSAGSKGTVETTRIGLYGAQVAQDFTIAGDFMFGASNTTSDRATGAGAANSTHAGDVFSGGLQVSTALRLAGLSLAPAAGIRIAAVNAGGFNETGNAFAAPFTVTGASSGYDSVQPYVTLDISRAFLTQSGIAVTPDAALGYSYEAGSRGRAVTLRARDGTAFAAQDIPLAGSAAQASVGISAGKGNWSLYARYSAQVAGNWDSQTAAAGLRVRF